jgi:phosphoribosylcarboxyaminoimidazole (NCAIR) mutase
MGEVMKLFLFSVLALFIATAIATAQVPVVTCPAGFTFVPNAMPPSCVPSMMTTLPVAPPVMTVDPNAAYEAALLQAQLMQQQQLAQQQALAQQMQMHQMWRMMHPEPGGVPGGFHH